MLGNFWLELQQPEYLHVLINPLPVYGLAIAFLGLLLAVIFRSRPAQTAALVLLFLCAASAWPVARYGEQAYDRVLPLADADGQAWLDAHANRADRLLYVFYALALLSLIAILAPKKWPRSSTPLVLATLILALLSLGAGGYIAYAGGKIRHREFRSEQPPPRKVHEHED
jgi:disulfide bond formation protein DsbB